MAESTISMELFSRYQSAENAVKEASKDVFSAQTKLGQAKKGLEDREKDLADLKKEFPEGSFPATPAAQSTAESKLKASEQSAVLALLKRNLGTGKDKAMGSAKIKEFLGEYKAKWEDVRALMSSLPDKFGTDGERRSMVYFQK